MDGLLNASTALRQKWEQAEADGWKIRLAGGDKRSQADPSSKTIWINPAAIADKKNFDANMAALIAHDCRRPGAPCRESARRYRPNRRIAR